MSTETGNNVTWFSGEIELADVRRELGNVLKNYRLFPGHTRLVGDVRINTIATPSDTQSRVFEIADEEKLDGILDAILDELIREGVVSLVSAINGETLSCTFVMIPNTHPRIQEVIDECLALIQRTHDSGEIRNAQGVISQFTDFHRQIGNMRTGEIVAGNLTQAQINKLVEDQVSKLLLTI